ncbi:MAG: hypothetical protein R3E11_09970 [Sphingobium sp.]|mgnify:FL=1|nr:hypothetical protein [Sphingobium sp.]MCP5399777.1 hypothetical protein [Sphingomonas sp.]
MSKEMRMARAAQSKLNLDDATFFSLTGQLKEAYAKLDGALSQTMRLNADMIDTAQRIGLEPETGQKLFTDFSDCIDTMMVSRQKMVTAHTRATGIRMKTNQAERGTGCWGISDGDAPARPELKSVA